MGVVFNAVYALTNGLVPSFILLQVLAWVLYRTIEEPCDRFTKLRFPMPAAAAGRGGTMVPER
jgi:peptidoglycan/LPS O-acetylase OafA/YrhL